MAQQHQSIRQQQQWQRNEGSCLAQEHVVAVGSAPESVNLLFWVDGWLNKYHWQPNSVCILRENRQTAKTTDKGGYYNANKNLTLTAIEHM